MVLLGLVSLLTDTSSEMIMPLLPAFVTGVLGGGALAIGWIEGLADATASILKLVSGRMADRMGRYRPLIIGGYGLSSLVRPLVAATGAVWQVVSVRVGDRVGKGFRTSPRDALIAASVEPSQRGAAFGLHRAMDHIGAVLGPGIAALLISFESIDLRTLFWLAAIPGALAMAVLVGGVRERSVATGAPAKATEEREPSDAGGLTRVLIPISLFTLGNASDVFLLVKAGEARAPLVTLPLLWMGLHVVKAAVSVPGGKLADRWGYRPVIVLGWAIYAAVYVGLGFATDPVVVAALFIVYGTYHGLTEGPERALIASVASRSRRGRAFGWYHASVGVMSLVASVGFGAIWSYWSSRAAFLSGAGVALAASLLLLAVGRRAEA